MCKIPNPNWHFNFRLKNQFFRSDTVKKLNKEFSTTPLILQSAKEHSEIFLRKLRADAQNKWYNDKVALAMFFLYLIVSRLMRHEINTISKDYSSLRFGRDILILSSMHSSSCINSSLNTSILLLLCNSIFPAHQLRC